MKIYVMRKKQFCLRLKKKQLLMLKCIVLLCFYFILINLGKTYSSDGAPSIHRAYGMYCASQDYIIIVIIGMNV